MYYFLLILLVSSIAKASHNDTTICLEGNFNIIQYVVIITSAVISIISFIIILHSFNGLFIIGFKCSCKQICFILLVLGFFFVFSLIMILFWTNPNFLKEPEYAPLVVVCAGISCVIVILFVILYLIAQKLPFRIWIIVFLDCFFIFIAAGLSISSNAYCTGHTQLPPITYLSYTHLEIFGAVGILVFVILILFKSIYICIQLKQEDRINKRKIVFSRQNNLNKTQYI